MSFDDQQAEAEKKVRLRLKARGYGYREFYDEMRELGLFVGLSADEPMWMIEVADVDFRLSASSRRATSLAARDIS